MPDFDDLTTKHFLLRKKKILHQLLGKGTAALHWSAREEIGTDRPQNTPKVDTFMLKEAMIFGQQGALSQVETGTS